MWRFFITHLLIVVIVVSLFDLIKLSKDYFPVFSSRFASLSSRTLRWVIPRHFNFLIHPAEWSKLVWIPSPCWAWEIYEIIVQIWMWSHIWQNGMIYMNIMLLRLWGLMWILTILLFYSLKSTLRLIISNEFFNRYSLYIL